MDLSRAPGGICGSCGRLRPLAELVAFWPRLSPELRQFVCRPLQSIAPFMNCFRELVGSVDEHGITLAAELDSSAVAVA